MNDTQRPPAGTEQRGGPAPARFDRGAASVALRHPEHLRRSTSDRKLAGVCAGLGRQLGVDPTIVRVAMVALALSGLGIALYFILWIVMPEEGDPRADTAVTRALPEQLRSGTGLAVAIGGGTVGLGVALAAVFGDVLPFNFPLPFPLVLVAAVVLFFWYRSRESSQRVVTEFRAQHPTGPQLDVSRDPSDPGAPGPQFWARPDPLGLYTDRAPSTAVAAHGEDTAVPAPRPRRAPALLRGGTLLATAASVGVLGIVAGTGVVVAPLLWVGIPLVVLGSGLVVTSRFGSAGGLATLGVAGAVAASGMAAVGPVDFTDRTWHPSTVAQAEALDLHPGHNVVDLRGLTLPDRPTTIDLSQTNGVLEVIVPADLDVTANATVTRGGYDLFDTVQGGGFSTARDADSPSTHTDTGADGPDASDQHLTLDLDVVNGYVEVRRSTP